MFFSVYAAVILFSAMVAVAQFPPTSCGNWRRSFGHASAGMVGEVRVMEVEETQPKLVRRINPTKPVGKLAPGTGLCGVEYFETDDAVCLYVGGPNSNYGGGTPGWLTGANPGNCNKKIWLMNDEHGQGNSIGAWVKDGCLMDQSWNVVDGCSALMVTPGLAKKLKLRNGQLQVTSWDFEGKPY